MNFNTLPLLIALALAGCSDRGHADLTENEKYNIQTAIDIHNTTARYHFSIDSIDGKADRWSAPYDIKKDRFLTLEKYLQYCKAHNYNPKQYAKFLD